MEELMNTAPPTRLSTETELYEVHKSEWLQTHRDEFVVIRGKDLLGFFREFHLAYGAGVKEYGINADFLVKRVTPQEPVFLVF
jgi:hypothetical protein